MANLSNHPMLAPYKPTAENPFDLVKAAHLLNRAGFGGTPDEVARIQAMGPAAAVEQLLDFPDAPADEQSLSDVPDLSGIDGVPQNFRALQMEIAGKSEADKKVLRQQFQASNREVILATIDWWLKRMGSGPFPLQEKLTLFWHGHFTTSSRDERLALLMWKQNETLRRYAAGNFGSFVHAISHDPAMLDYLNNTQNHKQHPNENYARELMELFTLGIGNYTETDVKEGARAFTGWSHDGENFVFHPQLHDTDVKTYLGQTGNFNGDDVINIILQQLVCAKFIAGELYKHFVSEELDESLASALGIVLRSSKYELRPLLRTLFNSQAFYSPQVIGAQIKSPIQLVVGTVRMLELTMPPERALTGALNQMGQIPFEPPNVRGWLGGRTWINTSTMFVRYNTGVWLTGGEVPSLGMGKPFGGAVKGTADALRAKATVAFSPKTAGTPEQVADYWINRLIQRPIDSEQRNTLIDALAGQPARQQNLRKMVQLIVSMPEYQLC